MSPPDFSCSGGCLVAAQGADALFGRADLMQTPGAAEEAAEAERERVRAVEEAAGAERVRARAAEQELEDLLSRKS